MTETSISWPVTKKKQRVPPGDDGNVHLLARVPNKKQRGPPGDDGDVHLLACVPNSKVQIKPELFADFFMSVQIACRFVKFRAEAAVRQDEDPLSGQMKTIVAASFRLDEEPLSGQI